MIDEEYYGVAGGGGDTSRHGMSPQPRPLFGYLASKMLQGKDLNELGKKKQEYELQDCTFKPRISQLPKAMAPIQEDEASVPIHERLVQKGKEIKDKADRDQMDSSFRTTGNSFKSKHFKALFTEAPPTQPRGKTPRTATARSTKDLKASASHERLYS